MPENFDYDIIMPLAQNQFKLVDICISRVAGAGNCAVDGELAELAGGNKKPRGGAEV